MLRVKPTPSSHCFVTPFPTYRILTHQTSFPRMKTWILLMLLENTFQKAGKWSDSMSNTTVKYFLIISAIKRKIIHGKIHNHFHKTTLRACIGTQGVTLSKDKSHVILLLLHTSGTKTVGNSHKHDCFNTLKNR